MPNILPFPNPVDGLLSAGGNAAGDAVSSGLNSAMESLWNFNIGLLGGVFEWIDRLGAPNVDPRTGPLAGVMPTLLWVGAAVLVILSFIQIGRGVLDGGRGFGTLLVGIAQYSVISAAGLGFLAVLVGACDALAVGLLKGGLEIDNWQGITSQNSVLTNAVHTVGGVGVGVLALFVLFPAVLGLVVETLVRHASILVLAATIPLLAAGLVQESTTRWFWTGLRWMIALLLLSPALALVIVLGLRTAAGAAGADGASQTAGQAGVQVAIGIVVLLISLVCPMAMFKLFAFIDPSTVSGGRVRGFLNSGSQGGGDSVPAAGSDSEGSDTPTANRFTSAMSAGAGMANDAASSAASTTGGMLDTIGAGHQGSPRHESSKSSKSKGRDQDSDATESEDDGTNEAQPQGPAPSDTSGAPTPPDGNGVTPGGPNPGGGPAGGGASSAEAAGSAGEAAAATDGVEAAAVVVAL